MSLGQKNQLARAASSYLRSAQHQPVDWHEWSEQAFAKAQHEGKPVLLDIGAVWCHWCHVMDRESYEDPEIAGLINEHFVPIKVDRDERPDVDTRYQAAVAAISGQGGWPLTAFLTPEGRPYFGGTYFPPEDRYGRPSFARVLRSMVTAFSAQRAEVEESAASVMIAVEQNETFSGHAGDLNEALLDKILVSILQQFDPRNGGFGSQPKFPHAAALELLIDAASRPGVHRVQAREVVRASLTRMAKGGIHDQLAGGFHRYSVDERWVVPHFEKMSYDNSEILRVYTRAFQSFVEPQFARVAAQTIRWMDTWLSDREAGGFYSSQDADASLDDDGDYFTWTRAEAQAALTSEEFAVAERFYALGAVGHMHHNPAKNVLYVQGELPKIAAELGKEEEDVQTLLRSAQNKMYTVRLQRQTPYIDRTIYTGWNSLCISAYLIAGRALALPEATAFALKSLDRVIDKAWEPVRGLFRVVAYSEAQSAGLEIPAVLDDYAFLGMATLDAWEATGELRYFNIAQQLCDLLLQRFYDPAEGGFFDREQHDREMPLGALAARRKPLQDAPTPAGNAVAAQLLLRMHALTENDLYRTRARETLETFAGVVEHLGLYAASYGQALRRFITPPLQICIVGADAQADELAAVATARFLLNKTVIRLQPDQLATLPSALAIMLPHLPGVQTGSGAVVCRDLHCFPPVSSPDALLEQLEENL